MKRKDRETPLIAVMTNNDDDIYCFRRELIIALREKGWDVLISCPDGPKFELMRDVEYIYDDPPIDRRGTSLTADAKLFLHYLRLLREHEPDVIFTYTAKPNIYAGLAARLTGCGSIANVTGFGSVQGSGKLVYGLVTRLFRLAFARAGCVMFQNAANMELSGSLGLVRGRKRLIPGSGVNTEKFSLLPYPDGGDGKQGPDVVFNYIGRILKDKGVDDFIAAAEAIKKRYPRTRFNMMGFIEPTEAEYESRLEDLGKRDVVHYLGSLRDVRPEIEKAHATIHPSTYGEGMSNVLLESASSGRPIISTDNHGCMETFVDGETGLMYRGGDVGELIKRIETFLAMPNEKRKEMGEKGRRYVAENFSRELVIKAYIEETQRLLAERKK